MRKKTHRDVAYLINREGIGYAIENYLDPDEIEDTALAEAVRDAAAALERITSILSDALDEEEC